MNHQIPSHLLDREVKVAVVGAGGTGSHILTGLAQLHAAMVALGHPGGLDVKVVDDDLVSESNIGRQMFFPSDVGLPKATVLVNRINMTMGTSWNAVVERVTDDSRLNSDIVIGCVDNRKARKAILAAVSRSGGGYWLDVGNRLNDGQVVLGEVLSSWNKNAPANRLPHAADLFPEIVDESQESADDGPSCSLAEALGKQSLFVNRGVALYALNLLWELFRHGQISYHGVFVNLKTARATPLAIDPDVWKRFGYKPKKPRASRKKA